MIERGIERGIELLKYLVPPKDNDRVPSWRWGVFVALILLLINMLASRGLLGGIGAHAAASDVRTMLQLQYVELMTDRHREICQSKEGSHTTLRQTLEDYQIRYSKLTGERYPLPSCKQ